jgi:CheY-like chemotaxis protein
LRSLRVLVVDNDARIVAATAALLAGLGHQPVCAADTAGALAAGGSDAILADYHLDRGEDGLSLIAALRTATGLAVPALLVTAEGARAVHERAAAMGVQVIAKPVDPALIERFLAAASVLQVQPQ